MVYVLCLVIIAFSEVSNAAMSLKEVWESTLQKNESVEFAQSELRAARWRFRQVVGFLLPTVNLGVRHQRQDIPGGLQSGVGGAFRLPNQTNAQVSWTQPLFQGLAEYGEIRRLRAQKKASEENLHAIQIELLSLVSSQFYAVLAIERDLEHLRRSLKLNQNRLEELRRREKIGRVKASEVLVSTSQVAILKAQILSAEQRRFVLRNELSQSSGLPDEFVLSGNSSVDLRSELKGWDQKLLSRPDVKRARLDEEAASAQIWSTRAAHFPRLELGGNYYLKRAGILEDSKWDLALTLSIPIFEGGAAFSRVRDAIETRKQAELRYQQLLRQLKSEVRALVDQIESLKQQMMAFENAVNASTLSYQAVMKDFDTGLSTELDVIQSLNQKVDTERSLDQVKFQLNDLLQEFRFATAAGIEEVL